MEKEPPGCDECGRLISTIICDECGMEFLDWDDNGFDDVMAGPAITSMGDFCCKRCLTRIESEMEMEMETETEYWEKE